VKSKSTKVKSKSTKVKSKSTKVKTKSKLTTAKYANRPGPPYGANFYKNKVKLGNDNEWYVSKPDKNGVYKWQRVNPKAKSKSKVKSKSKSTKVKSKAKTKVKSKSTKVKSTKATSKVKSKSNVGIFTIVLDLYYNHTAEDEILVNKSAIKNYVQQFTAEEVVIESHLIYTDYMTYIRNTAKWLGPMKISFEVRLNPQQTMLSFDDKVKFLKENLLNESLEDTVYGGGPGFSVWTVPFGLKRLRRNEFEDELGLIDYRKRDRIRVI
jgi:hypothetical protein